MRSSKTLADFGLHVPAEPQAGADRQPPHFGFIERRENVIFLGPRGVGKTHLAISLAIAAAQSRRCVYGTLADLVTSLEEAQPAGRLSQRRKTLIFPSLLMIDEIG
jgi:DNA replication protein DnaC